MVGGTKEKACYNSRNEKFRNSNRNYKGKLHQQNMRWRRISGTEDILEEMDISLKKI